MNIHIDGTDQGGPIRISFPNRSLGGFRETVTVDWLDLIQLQAVIERFIHQITDTYPLQ